jgi:hypothetical protein
MFLELKGFIVLKVFSSDVQSVFPFDILPLNENYKVFPFNHPFFIYSAAWNKFRDPRANSQKLEGM